LGYCWLSPQAGFQRKKVRDEGEFMLTTWTGYNGAYQPGACTTAYMVHKDVIPEMLSFFPCRDTLDVCWYKAFSDRVTRNNGEGMIVNIEPHVFTHKAWTGANQGRPLLQFGILLQDWETFPFHYGEQAREYTAKFASLVM
jgi:hypothetical protein